jgi:hypothetical protein
VEADGEIRAETREMETRGPILRIFWRIRLGEGKG